MISTLLGVSDDLDKYGKINIPGNAEQLLNAESISQLCQFVAWGHTNSVQVGNLLTSIVGDMKGVTMITDGTDAGPGGREDIPSSTDPNSKPKKSLIDASCPAV
eukprot:5331347-Ditylum_brightwellii.AAC.1